MHGLNTYRRPPDFDKLAKRHPALAALGEPSPSGRLFVDFKDPRVLRALTTALLKDDFQLDVTLREDRLCPTIANRLDYLLNVLDLEPYLHLGTSTKTVTLRVLDVGTGHVAIYALLMHRLRPACQVIATELDEASFGHARRTLADNRIEAASIDVRRATDDGRILQPVFDDDERYAFTVCNPPFFQSADEEAEGASFKAEPPSAAPTGAHNEQITPGGEVAFIGQMIEESLLVCDKCQLFTSLVGKYSSLQPLVDLLRRHEIYNYFVKSIRQGKTARWILGWSHGPWRFPDPLTRPDVVLPHTSFAALFPLANTYAHAPATPMRLADLARAVLPVLADVGLYTLSPAEQAAAEAAEEEGMNGPTDAVAEQDADEPKLILLEPTRDTWSRSARRAAARSAAEPTSGQGDATVPAAAGATAPDPIFRARIGFVPPPRRGGSAELRLEWVYGIDRRPVEGLWQYLVAKAGLEK
ncbi:hypothetical protein Q5752_001507 [Cryptotrichosporon argae]